MKLALTALAVALIATATANVGMTLGMELDGETTITVDDTNLLIGELEDRGQCLVYWTELPDDGKSVPNTLNVDYGETGSATVNGVTHRFTCVKKEGGASSNGTYIRYWEA